MADGADGRREADDALETRAVRVDDPALSETTNARLTEQLQEVVGAETVEVPTGRAHPSRGEPIEQPSQRWFASSNWMAAMIGGFAALVIGGIAGTAATGSMWFVAVAIVLDIIGIAVIATVVLRMTGVMERPDPTLVAAMQADGVPNPDQRFSEIVEEFREQDVSDGEHRSTAVQEDPVTAAAEQRSAMTPTSGRSRAVGP